MIYKEEEELEGEDHDTIDSYKQAIRLDPDCGVVYNLGGGRENSASVLECIYILEKSFNYKVNYSLSEKKQNWWPYLLYI